MPDVRSNPIMKSRHWALVIVRAVALCMVVYGSVYMLWGIGSFFGLSLGGSTFIGGFMSFWDKMFNPFWYGFAVFVPGLTMQISSRRIARWIVPVLTNECPQCGYALRQLTTTRCPECGFVFAAASDKEPAPPR